MSPIVFWASLALTLVVGIAIGLALVGQGYLWLRARAWSEVSQVFGPGGRQRL